MSLLKKLICGRAGLVAVTIGLSVCALLVSLWWNAQLSAIINMVNAGSAVPIRVVIAAAR